MSEKIHVALTFDDAFWAPAFAVMRSAAVSSSRPTDLTFHLIHDGLSQEHRRELDSVATEFGITLLDYPLDANAMFVQLQEGFVFRWRLNKMVLARLIFEHLLPSDVTRLIYLDCDVMVRGPIEALWETDLAGRPIGGVMDQHRHHVMLGEDLRHKRDLFSYHDGYFNGGVLLIDLALWSRENILSRVEAMRDAGDLKRLYYDQDILNLVFKNNWMQLDFRWNVGNALPAHEIFDPHILHYSGDRKPWHPFPGVAFERLYRRMMTRDLYNRYLKFQLGQRIRRLFTGRR